VKTYDRALDLLSRRDHSEFELIQKLKRRGCSIEEIQAAIERLKENGVLSGKRYSQSRARSLLNRGYGSRYISAALRQKRAELPASELNQLQEDMGLSDEDQAKKILEKKLRSLKKTPVDKAEKQKVRARLLSFLVRRGVPAGIASRVLKSMWG
jgi:regulatory protein